MSKSMKRRKVWRYLIRVNTTTFYGTCPTWWNDPSSKTLEGREMIRTRERVIAIGTPEPCHLCSGSHVPLPHPERVFA